MNLPMFNRQGVSRWQLFGVVSIALTMASIDQTIVSVALATIHTQLHAAVNWTSWVVSAYALGLVIAMPLAGRTSDLYGRRQVFLASIVLFTVSSLACGSVGNIEELIALRLVQAIGGGAFLPSAVGIISDAFGEDRDRAIGMTSSILPIGGLIAPLLGGVLIHYWTWRGIFWINGPIGIGLYVVAYRTIPDSPRRSGARTDAAGVGLLSLTLLGAMAMITLLGDRGASPSSPAVVVSFLVSAVGLALLMRHLRRTAAPLIPRGLVLGRGFFVMNLINLCIGCFMQGLGNLLPLYAQDRYHLSSLDAATIITGRAIGLIGLAVVAAWVLRRMGHRTIIGIGILGIVAGTVLLALGPVGLSPYWWLSLGGLISGSAFGFAAPAINNASLSLAPEHVGAITGLRGLFRQLGTILGVTVPSAIVARSLHPGAAFAAIFFVAAAVLFLLLIAVRGVPEHGGSW